MAAEVGFEQFWLPLTLSPSAKLATIAGKTGERKFPLACTPKERLEGE